VHYFNQVGIVFGAVTWPHKQDIAPETLLAEIIQAPKIKNLGFNNEVHSSIRVEKRGSEGKRTSGVIVFIPL
jgi:hypothetical protein